MKLQRQHFLLSYLKTLSVGPVGVSNSQPPASRPGEQPSELPVGGQKKNYKEEIRNIWLENANSKNIYSKMNLEGLNYISTKELQATFTKQSSLII